MTQTATIESAADMNKAPELELPDLQVFNGSGESGGDAGGEGPGEGAREPVDLDADVAARREDKRTADGETASSENPTVASESETASPAAVTNPAVDVAAESVGVANQPVSAQPGARQSAQTFGSISSDHRAYVPNPRHELEYNIREQQIKVADLAAAWARKQAAAKHAKKEFDLEVENLRDMQGRLEQGDYPLPFQGYVGDGLADGSPATSASLPGQQELPLAESVTGPAAGATAADPETVDESWKLVPISELGLAKGIVKSLTESGLANLGALADYTAADKRLTDIDGIGAGKAEKIEEATLKYWAEHPRSEAVTETAISGSKTNESPENTARTTGDQDSAAETSTGALAAGSESAEETEAYTAGCAAMLAETEAAEAKGEGWEAEMPKNPHKKGTRLWAMFDKGVQDTLAN